MSQVEVDKIIPQSGTTLTIGDSGDTIAIASGATLSGSISGITNLTITGDLTVDTDTLFVDASENTVVVGGTDATSWNTNADELVVAGASAGGMTFYNPTQTNIFFADGTTGDDVSRGRIQYVHSGDSLIFGTDATERMRIDSSGNLLVGKSSLDYTTAGTIIRSDGALFSTTDGANTAVFERLTSDGDIIRFEKDNTTVGRIGVLSSRLYTGTGDTGLFFNDQTDQIQPWDTSTNSARDAAIDLGTTDRRFKDLYLSGGAYLGGTGSANLLDDYEEGTWTPVFEPASGSFTSITAGSNIGATYTRIGDVCYVNVFYRTDAITVGSASGSVRIGGLPFTAADGFSPLMVGYAINFAGDQPFSALPRNGFTNMSLYYKTSSNGNSTNLNVTDLATGSNDNNIYIGGVYKVA